MILFLSVLVLALKSAVAAEDDASYEEYENAVVKGAPSQFKYVYERKMANENGIEDEGFGKSVSLVGDRLLVGAFQDSTRGQQAGAAHIFAMDSSGVGWTSIGSLVSNATAAYDYFGWAVSLSDNFALVGAWQNDGAGSNAGAAYFFLKQGDYFTDGAEKWVLHSTVYGWENDDSFGIVVAIANDNLAVVGAPGGTNSDGDYGSGYVSVFRYMGNVWTESDVLEASDAMSGLYFGMSLALDASSKLVAVGAYGHDFYGNDHVGAVYVIDISSSGDPDEIQMLKARDASGGDEFGRSVAILGNTIVVGAPGDDDAGDFAGSVYIFQYGYDISSNAQWVQKSKIVPQGDCTFCYFGTKVAMTNDTLAVGLYGGSEIPGSVWLYKRDLEADSDFDFIFTLNCTDFVNGDLFGSSVFINDKYLAVGALASNGYDYETGAVYVYSKLPNFDEESGLSTMLKASLAVAFVAGIGAGFTYFLNYGSKPDGYHEVSRVLFFG